MSLNIRIRTARLGVRLTQAELARRLNVTRTAVVNWESATNRSRPSSERLEEICRQTNVAWEWLATGRGPTSLSIDSILAADAELIDDPTERRLLQAFRARSSHIKQAVLTLLEAGGVMPRGGDRKSQL